jgi:glycosyltransferase involved in cell wall biosynthesis
MKIALFTPTHHLSAIGRVTALVRTALQVAGHDVAVVATELNPLRADEVNDSLRDSVSWRDDQAVRQIVVESDIVFHQIGNYYAYHAGSVHWLPEIGGCIALHDFFLGDMFLSYIPGHELEASDLLERWYGTTIEQYHESAASGMFLERTWPSQPLTEWLCQYADGVVTHSSFGLAGVIRSTPAPVVVVPLPYALDDSTAAPFEPVEAPPETDRLSVLTFGHINSNKLCADVIMAIASHRRSRRSITYRICGTIESAERHRLAALAADLGVDVIITGHLSPHDLARELDRADIIVCTRKPALESASASAIEGLLSGTPLMVLDTGFYADLSPEVVLHIDHRDVVGSLKSRFAGIVEGRIDLAPMAEHAAEYARTTFRADNYASELVELGLEAARRKPLRELETAFVRLVTTPDGNLLPETDEIFRRDTQIFRP